MRSVWLLGLMALILYPAMSSAATLDRIKENGVVNIGYREDAPPFSFRNTVGDPVGYTVDLCRAVVANIKEQLGLASISIKYVAVSAEDRFEAIREGRIDLLCGPTRATLSGRALVDFSLPTFVDGAGVLFLVDGPVDRGIADGISGRKQRGIAVGLEAFQALAGLKVGVRAGTTTEKVVRNTLTKRLVDAEIVSLTDHEEGLRQLEAGEISAYFADQGVLLYLTSKSQAPQSLRRSKLWVGLRPQRRRANETLEEELFFPRPDLQLLSFTGEPYALALPLGDGDFRLAIDRALSHIYRSGAVWLIYSRYFSRADDMRVLYAIGALPEQESCTRVVSPLDSLLTLRSLSRHFRQRQGHPPQVSREPAWIALTRLSEAALASARGRTVRPRIGTAGGDARHTTHRVADRMDGLVRLHEVAVNIPAQALNDLTLPEQIFGLLDGEGLPGSSLVLEVTETGAMKDVVSAIYMSALSSQT